MLPKRFPDCFIHIDKDSALPYYVLGETGYGRINGNFRELLPSDPHGRILDWGCSMAASTKELARLYPGSSVVGVELHHYNWSNKTALPISFVVADGYKLPFSANTFDLAIFSHNLQYAMDRMSSAQLDAVNANIVYHATPNCSDGAYGALAPFY